MGVSCHLMPRFWSVCQIGSVLWDYICCLIENAPVCDVYGGIVCMEMNLCVFVFECLC